MVGRTLSHYRVTHKLGAGGMGEVYRARDERLGRDVALKVLPEGFGRDPDRMARFEREAHLLASLNHPNIAAIHGLEEAAGTRFLVLELVEGETLAEQLARGSLPVAEALKLAQQIAEALEAAHEKGVVHRDLKPANIKVTPEGRVKLLDFGLAKALASEAPLEFSDSPTISDVATRPGAVLGTAAYMSPEQARGRPVDKRADIWAFGCVLYEMLTAARPFGGETRTDTLAAILNREPAWTGLPSTTPASVRALLQRCLQKEARLRLRDIGDALLELEAALTAPPPELAPTAPAASAPAWPRLLPWSIALVAVLAASVVLWRARHAPPAPSQVTRFAISLPEGSALVPERRPVPLLAVSPDGTKLAYVAARGSERQLYLRPLSQAESAPLPGTAGARAPFFSPDGQWLGFFAAGKLKKVPIGGGSPQVICDSPGGRGASWGQDDTIFFTPGYESGVWRVPAVGGAPQQITTPDLSKGEFGHHLPEALPGGKAILLTIVSKLGVGFTRIAVHPLAGGEPRVLVEGATNARYSPTGHLVYAQEGRLLA
ncbi:MAG: protein kinase, partial [Acidobacteria bacterium]|nr:protein kinase [Acidobacteriota bacterium]